MNKPQFNSIQQIVDTVESGKNVYYINVCNKVINKYGSWWVSSNINQRGYIEHPLSDFEGSLDRFFTVSNTFS